MFLVSLRTLLRDRRVAFTIVGGINTLNGFLLYVLLYGVFSFPYAVALPTAYVLAAVCAFYLHRRFVFRVTGHVVRDLVRFLLVNAGGLALNELLLTLAVEVVGLNPILGQLVSGALTMVVSFIGHREFSFRRSSQLKGQPG